MARRDGMRRLIWGAVILSSGLARVGAVLGQSAGSSDSHVRPRPGLSAQQTKEAVALAGGAMQELRKKTDGASSPDSDPREYVVNVEMLSARPPAKASRGNSDAAKPGDNRADRPPLAVVTTYRYFDDTTVFSTIDLATGKVTQVQSARHIHTALSDAEFEDAKTLARTRSDEVGRLYERFGDKLDVYPQFSQFRVKGEDRLHRVVHLNYRVGTRDLSYPRPQVDMTTRQVTVPPSEVTPRAPRAPRP
jgi:hypothetical protein